MRVLLAALCLMSCGASPAPSFFGAARHDVVAGGVRFAVFRKGNEAEVVRLDYASRAQRQAVPALMQQAIRMATGCDAVPGSMRTGLPGDTGEARFDLECAS